MLFLFSRLDKVNVTLFDTTKYTVAKIIGCYRAVVPALGVEMAL